MLFQWKPKFPHKGYNSVGENALCSGFSVYVSFTYKPDSTKPNLIWNTFDLFKDHTFKLSGMYTFHKGTNKTSYQINPRTGEDLVCLDL